MSLEPDLQSPVRVVGTRVGPAVGRLRLRTDTVEWANGDRADMNWVQAPDSALMVAVDDLEFTHLVRQWRHPWAATSWEVPAGTLEPGEDPLAGARRELLEEAGLIGESWIKLGTTRPSAVMDCVQHQYLVRGLRPGARAPELYEQDMIVRRLPLAEAVAAALRGSITHTGSVSALLLAAETIRRGSL
ncbi:MAG: NUDIX domain-containing protein [Candidatus Dormibacteraceae bacterium]